MPHRSAQPDLLLRYASEALLAVDPATLRITQANQASARWLGYPHEGMAGRLITEIDISLPSAVYWNEVAAGVRETLERVRTQYRRADGRLIEAEQSVIVAQENGTEYLVVRALEVPESHTDTTDYSAQLRTILESTAEGIMVLDLDEQVVSLNRRLAVLWSLPTQIVARRESAQILDFMAAQLLEPQETQARLRALLDCPDDLPAEILALSNGRVLEKRAQPHVVDGKRLGTVLTFMEITDRVRTERTLKSDRDYLVELVSRQITDLRQAKDEADQANQAKSDFLAKISHELRTPMHAILSFSSFGKRSYATAPPETIRNYFTRIHDAGERLLDLVNDLLDLSKSRAGKLSIETQVQDIRPVVHAVVDELHTLARAKEITLECELGAAPAAASVDGPRLGQVVRNLLSNAIKFTPVWGNIVLRLSQIDGDTQGAWHKLEVIDSGAGIPADELELIFEQFEQGADSVKQASGTGLGLAIARELIVAHGGSIHASNNPDGGATFTALLPATRLEVADEALLAWRA